MKDLFVIFGGIAAVILLLVAVMTVRESQIEDDVAGSAVECHVGYKGQCWCVYRQSYGYGFSWAPREVCE